MAEGRGRGRRGAVAVLGALVLAGSSAVWAPAGQADGGRVRGDRAVTCTGSERTEFGPGLSLVPRPTRVHAEARYTCTVAPGRTVPATGAIDAFSPQASCLTVSSPRGRETVRYADGRTSVVVYDSGRALRVAGVNAVELTGRVAGGRGAGQAARRTLVVLPGQMPTDCLGPGGVRRAEGGVQLELGPE
ncbi:hypothetical protein [Streptomyces sp. I05A-00742]|uniref:hypothetical protein n=1 Tax=Streptomyces sp. I05A-00742 TaxID=2732853 RepID=UPI001488A56D|nr:hypothetical protein [Streptomyces sp. I05A-00742]